MTTRKPKTDDTALRVDSRDPGLEVLKALSDPIRLGIMTRIAGTDELPCTTLERELPISKSTISYHMRILHGAGLIDIRKQGKFFHYSARSNDLDSVIPGLMSWLTTRSPA